ncbi:MAG: hypothetical protein IH998_17870 [Proteobacteria bacterium]|nr:hypothetical protein [Pseudomonadota bacterium]
MTEKTVAMWSVKALRGSVLFWFAVATTGQLAFVLYIAGFYGRAAVQGDFARWNQVLVGGYVPGGLAGNLVLAMHLLLAAVITLGGPLQLVPAIRRRWPRFHSSSLGNSLAKSPKGTRERSIAQRMSSGLTVTVSAMILSKSYVRAIL